MIQQPFTERARQARLYAAQVRRRREMGNQYAHHETKIIRRLKREQFQLP